MNLHINVVYKMKFTVNFLFSGLKCFIFMIDLYYVDLILEVTADIAKTIFTLFFNKDFSFTRWS